MGPASPLGALQPDLYRLPDGPVYLTAPESSHAVGRLHLRVKYDYHLFDLTVHLIEGNIFTHVRLFRNSNGPQNAQKEWGTAIFRYLNWLKT